MIKALTRYFEGDNLFDRTLTTLDFVKGFLLIVSFFSTYFIADTITPEGPFAWVRIWSTVGVVEFGLVAFERAVNRAKNEAQTSLSGLGYVLCLGVIIAFFFAAGFLEFSGPTLLGTELGNYLGISWTVNELVLIFTLTVIGLWLVALSLIAQGFELLDPKKAGVLRRNKIEGDLDRTNADSLHQALLVVGPEISIQRALVEITTKYGPELKPNQLSMLLVNAESQLRQHHGLLPAPPPAPPSTPAPVPSPFPVVAPTCINCFKEHDGKYNFMFCDSSCELSWLDKSAASDAERRAEILNSSASAPVSTRPTRPVPIIVPVPAPVLAGGNGNGHNHPTP